MDELACAHWRHRSVLGTLLRGDASLASYATNVHALVRDATSTLNTHAQVLVLVQDTFDKALITHIGDAMVYSFMQRLLSRLKKDPATGTVNATMNAILQAMCLGPRPLEGPRAERDLLDSFAAMGAYGDKHELSRLTLTASELFQLLELASAGASQTSTRGRRRVTSRAA